MTTSNVTEQEIKLLEAHRKLENLLKLLEYYYTFKSIDGKYRFDLNLYEIEKYEKENNIPPTKPSKFRKVMVSEIDRLIQEMEEIYNDLVRMYGSD
jgi:hypothetical protein